MLGQACQYRPEQHRLLDHGILRWLKRQVSDDRLRSRLFFYFHNLYRTWVIGLWTSEPKGTFVDVLNLGYSPGSFDRVMAEGLVKNLHAPLTIADTLRQLRESESNFYHQQNDEAAALAERQKQLLPV